MGITKRSYKIGVMWSYGEENLRYLGVGVGNIKMDVTV
jgi:hypothetical protein